MLRLLALCALAGCSSPSPIRSVEQRAVYGTPHGVQDLTIASIDADSHLLAWTEGPPDSSQPSWLALAGSGTLPVHHAELSPIDLSGPGRVWSPLLRSPLEDDVWVRLVHDGTSIQELTIGADGERKGFRVIPGLLGSSAPELEAVVIGNQLVAIGFYFEATGAQEISAVLVDASDELSIPIEISQGHPPCFSSIRAAPLDSTAALLLFSGCTTEDGTVQLPGLATLHAEGDGVVPELHDAGTSPAPGVLEEVVAVDGAFGSLWRAADGGHELFLQATPGALELTTPAFRIEPGAERVRLLSTLERVVLIWTAGIERRVVVAEPAALEVEEPTEWPLGDACPISSYVPGEESLTYACVGPCEGQGCAENWVFVGRVDLD